MHKTNLQHCKKHIKPVRWCLRNTGTLDFQWKRIRNLETQSASIPIYLSSLIHLPPAGLDVQASFILPFPGSFWWEPNDLLLAVFGGPHLVASKSESRLFLSPLYLSSAGIRLVLPLHLQEVFPLSFTPSWDGGGEDHLSSLFLRVD